eukprot:TRINITY_DN36190_c0_g1_i2.p1 TRINITY_DN36190_c0_g1~~TRINITY_DN36190_c0_g1_i2.p1  ORF type:complete len:102 (+),score=24.21 TRINITY_DN36190_c0_g1_i2:99-404(+)
MIRRPPRSTLSSSSAASDVYKRQEEHGHDLGGWVSQQEGSLDRTLCHTHLQLSPNAPAVLVHRVFKMLGPGAVYVTDAGLLKGAIFKQALVTHGYKATLTD